jgi:hypothetical protein
MASPTSPASSELPPSQSINPVPVPGTRRRPLRIILVRPHGDRFPSPHSSDDDEEDYEPPVRRLDLTAFPASVRNSFPVYGGGHRCDCGAWLTTATTLHHEECPRWAPYRIGDVRPRHAPSPVSRRILRARPECRSIPQFRRNPVTTLRCPVTVRPNVPPTTFEPWIDLWMLRQLTRQPGSRDWRPFRYEGFMEWLALPGEYHPFHLTPIDAHRRPTRAPSTH